MMNKYIILLFFCIVSCGEKDNISIVVTSKALVSDSLALDKGYNYYNFASSNRYLVWYETYLSEIYILDYREDDLIKVKINKGRGPGELTGVGDIVVIDDAVYILNKSQRKIVKYDIQNKGYNDVLLYQEDFRYMTSYGETIFFRGVTKDGILYRWNIDSNEVDVISKSNNETIKKVARMNSFEFDGVTLSNNQYLLYAKYYKPEFVVYDHMIDSLLTIVYDDVEIGKDFYKVNEFGFVSYPPENVSFLLEDVSFIPNTNELAILGTGKSLNRIYDHRIHIYDLEKREYTNEIILDSNKKFRYIQAIEDGIFLFDNERNMIYKVNI